MADRKLQKHLWYVSNDYQLMCMNCNKAKGSYGECPHEVNK